MDDKLVIRFITCYLGKHEVVSTSPGQPIEVETPEGTIKTWACHDCLRMHQIKSQEIREDLPCLGK